VRNFLKERYLNIIKNNRNLIANITGSIGVKGLSLIVSLITLPAYMNYFEDKKTLGLWFSLLSILNWILVFDIGIGNGLRNHLVEALVEEDYLKAKKYISSAYFIIGLVSLVIIVMGYIGVGLCNWNTILNISDQIVKNNLLVMVVRLVFIGVVLQFFLKLILSILYAMQKTALSNFISLLSQSLVLLFVLTFKAGDIKSSLLYLSTVYILTINVPLIFATIFVFLKPLKQSKPNFKYYVREYANSIMQLGYMFFWIQITLLVINSSNEFLITRLFGPEDVVEYQVYNKIFGLFLMFFSIFTTPIWSSITKAVNENRINWIKKMYKFLNVSAIIVCIGCFAIVPAFRYIVNIWLGTGKVRVDISIALLFAIFNSLMIFIYSATCIANGIGKLKTQMFCNTFAAIIKIPLTIFFSNIIGSWISIVLVNIIIMFPVVVIQPILIVKQLGLVSSNEN